MWQYTTETIINSNKGKLAGGKRIVVDSGKLLIEGVGTFDLSKISTVWKRPYQPAEKAYKEITIPTINAFDPTSGEQLYYRLQIWVSEEGTIRPELQNAMLMKSLPFQFEVKAMPAGTNGTNSVAEEVAYALNKAINKMFAKKGADRLFTAKVNGAVIELEATDCYIRFDEVKLDRINDSVNLTGYQDYVSVPLTPSANDKRGTEGNGTVARLVKNIRIPTKVSLDPFGADHGGKPVPGGEYAQYMFEYITDRSHVGHQVFGSVGDQSLTTHILFLNEKDAQLISDFEACFAANVVTPYTPQVATVASAQAGKGAKK